MTTQTEHAPFPTDETLAAYIDGRLDDETRKHVVEHIAECPECFEVVQVNNEMAAAAPSAQVIRWPRNALIGLATAAALVGVVFLTPLRERIGRHDDLRELSEAAPPKRPIDGRLTQFPYRERAPSYRGSVADSSDLDSFKFLSVATKVRERAEQHPDIRRLHAEGVSYLALGDAQLAMPPLEKARQLSSSRDPQVLSDLAAAYLAAGKYHEAGEAANLAWNMQKTPEIAWNRALAEQRLGHRAAAIIAWNDYLAINDSPDWAKEAHKHLVEMRSDE